MAAEEKTVRVLNYNPGPTITDMQHEVGDKAWSEELKQWSKSWCIVPFYIIIMHIMQCLFTAVYCAREILSLSQRFDLSAQYFVVSDGTSGAGDFLTPDQAVAVLFNLLEEDKYASGTFFNAAGK